MAKGIGLIGNFKGKVGNMVGYKLSDSNTGNTQGIRVYQPIVKNPKSAAQAEQRAKLAPINATYRALKMIIDRGNEGLPYGNKARLAWLKKAFKANNMPWFEKGASVDVPVPCQLTFGSLPSLDYEMKTGNPSLYIPGVTAETTITTIGQLSTALLAGYPWLKAGDQITLIITVPMGGVINADIFSFVVDTASSEAFNKFEVEAGGIFRDDNDNTEMFCAIVSREGANGEHLRSSSVLFVDTTALSAEPFSATAKTEAIASYQSSASANADWAEESIQ